MAHKFEAAQQFPLFSTCIAASRAYGSCLTSFSWRHDPWINTACLHLRVICLNLELGVHLLFPNVTFGESDAKRDLKRRKAIHSVPHCSDGREGLMVAISSQFTVHMTCFVCVCLCLCLKSGHKLLTMVALQHVMGAAHVYSTA